MARLMRSIAALIVVLSDVFVSAHVGFPLAEAASLADREFELSPVGTHDCKAHSAATALPLISTPPSFTRISPTVTKSPAQKTDRRASREILERVVESDISVIFYELVFCFFGYYIIYFVYLQKLCIDF